MNIVVTGAASGIGRQTVTLLAERGHRVVATDVDSERLTQVAQDLGWLRSAVFIEHHDVTSSLSWGQVMRRAADRWPQLDALVNMAGVVRVEAVVQLDPASVSLQLDVNTKGVILGTQAAAAVMVGQGAGRIVNMASLAALAPVPGISVYSASKFAVRGFSLAAATELEPAGVQVSVIYPDAVDTPMVDYQLSKSGAALTFSGPRILTADEVARAVVRLVEGPWRAEMVLPRSRGWLARLAGALPRRVNRWLVGRLTRKGLARQQALRAARTQAAHEPEP